LLELRATSVLTAKHIKLGDKSVYVLRQNITGRLEMFSLQNSHAYRFDNFLEEARNLISQSKVAKTVKDACELVEAGFEYVCEMDDVKIFRKRK
jgi:hypothetical protein